MTRCIWRWRSRVWKTSFKTKNYLIGRKKKLQSFVKVDTLKIKMSKLIHKKKKNKKEERLKKIW